MAIKVSHQEILYVSPRIIYQDTRRYVRGIEHNIIITIWLTQCTYCVQSIGYRRLVPPVSFDVVTKEYHHCVLAQYLDNLLVVQGLYNLHVHLFCTRDIEVLAGCDRVAPDYKHRKG